MSLTGQRTLRAGLSTSGATSCGGTSLSRTRSTRRRRTDGDNGADSDDDWHRRLGRSWRVDGSRLRRHITIYRSLQLSAAGFKQPGRRRWERRRREPGLAGRARRRRPMAIAREVPCARAPCRDGLHIANMPLPETVEGGGHRKRWAPRPRLFGRADAPAVPCSPPPSPPFGCTFHPTPDRRRAANVHRCHWLGRPDVRGRFRRRHRRGTLSTNSLLWPTRRR
jgi:hypothetical protein